MTNVAIIGGGWGSLGSWASLADCVRWIQPSIELYALPNRIGYDEPTPYKIKPYQMPRVNRALHRQSVNRGK